MNRPFAMPGTRDRRADDARTTRQLNGSLAEELLQRLFPHKCCRCATGECDATCRRSRMILQAEDNKGFDLLCGGCKAPVQVKSVINARETPVKRIKGSSPVPLLEAQRDGRLPDFAFVQASPSDGVARVWFVPAQRLYANFGDVFILSDNKPPRYSVNTDVLTRIAVPVWPGFGDSCHKLVIPADLRDRWTPSSAA